jgi:hypothetical protein
MGLIINVWKSLIQKKQSIFLLTLFGHLPTPSVQNLFHPLLWFCWRENIRDNKKDILFLLVWDKDSYTERFVLLLPCTCVLVHLYQISSLLPSPLPTVASGGLRILYSLLCSEHINYIQGLAFLSFPYPSCVQSPLSVGPMSNTITGHLL